MPPDSYRPYQLEYLGREADHCHQAVEGTEREGVQENDQDLQARPQEGIPQAWETRVRQYGSERTLRHPNPTTSQGLWRLPSTRVTP
jgi:hypothetical protein